MEEVKTGVEDELVVQVEVDGEDRWLPEDDVVSVLANERTAVMTGLKMVRARGAALQMLPAEVAAFREAAEAASLDTAA